jgi:hypothetical protein
MPHAKQGRGLHLRLPSKTTSEYLLHSRLLYAHIPVRVLGLFVPLYLFPKAQKNSSKKYLFGDESIFSIVLKCQELFGDL